MKTGSVIFIVGLLAVAVVGAAFMVKEPKLVERGVEDVDATQFQARVIETSNTRPVLVKFHATWCSACVAMKPFDRMFAKRYRGSVDIVQVDVDKNEELSKNTYAVSGVPAYRLFRNGNVTGKHDGTLNEQEYTALVEGS